MSGKRPCNPSGTSVRTDGVETPIAYRVLEALGGRRTAYVRVPDIADALSCKHDDVRGAIGAIRRLGYSISERSGAGIRLDTETDVIVRSDLLGRLGTRALGRPPVCFLELDSTNALATRAALAGASHGTVVLAEHQKAGRGRLGRTWFSPPGAGLWFSLILRYELTVARTWMLTLGAAVALGRRRGGLDRRTSQRQVAERPVPERSQAGGHPYRGARRRRQIGLRRSRHRDKRQPGGGRLSRGPAGYGDLHSVRHGSNIRSDGTSGGRVAVAGTRIRWPGCRKHKGTVGRAKTRMLGNPVFIDTDAGPIQGVAEDVGSDGALLVRGADGGLRRVLAGDVGGDAKV